MPATEMDSSTKGPLDMVGRRRYIVPSLSRYGTLTDLTLMNGMKHGDDSHGGVGNGCGQGANFLFSCAAAQGTP